MEGRFYLGFSKLNMSLRLFLAHIKISILRRGIENMISKEYQVVGCVCPHIVTGYHYSDRVARLEIIMGRYDLWGSLSLSLMACVPIQLIKPFL